MSPNHFRLPNLIIAGVHKAGTTSLYSYLAKHPQICPSYKKEIGFFMPLMAGGVLPALDEYARYFEHCSNELFRLEASPSYLYGKERIAEAIKKELGQAKIIVILRNPTDRLVSYLSRAVSNSILPEDLSFGDYVARSEEHVKNDEESTYAKSLRDGMYVNYLPAWQRAFGSDFRIVFFDDLKSDAYSVIAEICSWLDLDVGDFAAGDFTIENQTLHYRRKKLHRQIRDFYIKNETFWRRHPKLKKWLRGIYNRFNADADADADGQFQIFDEATLSRLRSFYEPYNRQLKSFLEANGYNATPAWLNQGS